MVGSAGHCANAISTRWQATGDSSRKSALAIAVIVDAFEESECLRIWRSAGSEAIPKGLDGNMGMADDKAILQCLWCRVVGRQGIRECAGCEVVDLDIDSKVCVCRKGISRSGIGDDT